MTQAKIERYHRSTKNAGKLETFYFPCDLAQAIAAFVEYDNHEGYHESLDNLSPAAVYFGKAEEVKGKREEIKKETMKQRRQLNRQMAPDTLFME